MATAPRRDGRHATNDIDGEPELPSDVLRNTVAGAILGELDLLVAETVACQVR